MIGTVLAHYEILEKIGAGGMGEVYRARDTKLDREVALKVLPPEMADDPERRKRFEREAKAVASLQHPNIVTIHSVEEANGTHFLTMELVSGKTLNELIPAEGMTLEKFFEIAVPLAEAVTAAHARGITHRDLKPANVMVGKDGQLKVLDFGLAKLIETAEVAGAMTMAGESVTAEGKILGTVAYMAPEQAEGKGVDPRSDVFSLGVIFYEMATGERPFKGDTNISTISSILREDPPSVTELKKAMPRHLSRIVKRCLMKDPDRRYQSAHDLRNDLLELREEIASGELTVSPGVLAPRSGRPAWLVPVLGLVAVVILAAVFVVPRLGSRGGSASVPGAASSSMEITRMTSTGKSVEAAISPDGRYLAHVLNDEGNNSLWVTQVSTSSSVEIVPGQDVGLFDPTFSPEGDFIYYIREERRSETGELYRVPVLGGAARRVMEKVNSTVSFSPDGKQFAFLRAEPGGTSTHIVVANRDGSEERVVASQTFPVSYAENPSWSPDGRVLAAPVASIKENVEAWVEILDLKDGKNSRLTSQPWIGIGEMAWLPDGSGVIVAGTEGYFSPSQLWLVSYPGGSVRRITNDINDYNGVSLTADGEALAVGIDEPSYSLWVVPAGGSEAPRQITAGTRKVDGVGVEWTADDKILYGSTEGGSAQIWTIDTDGTSRSRLTGEAINAQPEVSGDGRYIYFTSTRSQGVHIWRMDRDGGNPTQVTHGQFEFDGHVTPDGAWLVYVGGTEQLLYRIPLDGGDPAALTDTRVNQPILSPDGTRLAYRAFDPDQKRVMTFILPVEGGEPVAVLDIPSGNHVWTPDGTGITYAYEQGGVSNLWIQPLEGGSPQQISRFDTDQIADFAWSPDGSRLVVSRGNTTSDVVLLRNFR